MISKTVSVLKVLLADFAGGVEPFSFVHYTSPFFTNV